MIKFKEKFNLVKSLPYEVITKVCKSVEFIKTLGIFAFLVIILIWVLLSYSDAKQKNISERKERGKINYAIDKTQKQYSILVKEEINLKSDPLYIERLIRKRYNKLMENEVILSSDEESGRIRN